MSLTKELQKFAVQFSRSSAQHRGEAEDFYQEIMIVFHRMDREDKPMDAPLKLLIARSAARNRIRDLVKRRNVRVKYHVPLDEDLIALVDPLPGIDARIIFAQAGARDPILRKVLDHMLEGFTVEEVAIKLRLHKRTVYRMLQRMRASMDTIECIVPAPERGDTIQND